MNSMSEHDAAPAHRGVEIVVEGERETRAPKRLMDAVNLPFLGKALLFSVVAHVLLLGLTSLSLFSDYAEHGVLAPAKLKQIKREQEQLAQKSAVVEVPGPTQERAVEVPDDRPAPATPEGVRPPTVVTEATRSIKERPVATEIDLNAEMGLE